jgi:hypothetical protein
LNGSVPAVLGNPGYSAYAASKGAIPVKGKTRAGSRNTLTLAQSSISAFTRIADLTLRYARLIPM